jgi:hypothetical protein
MKIYIIFTVGLLLLVSSCGQDELNSKRRQSQTNQELGNEKLTAKIDCSAIFQPVCAHPPMPECTNPDISCPMVLPEAQTYANPCEMGKANAFFSHYGECVNDQDDSEANCPAIYAPVCAHPPMPDCSNPDLSCPTVLPAAQTYSNTCEMGVANASFSYYGECNDDEEDLRTACPAIYAPVCAQPVMPTCPEGVSCAAVMPSPKTYASMCILNQSNSQFLYEGECKD